MSKCIKCGNFYFSEPDTDNEVCFRCEIEEKDYKIAELEKQLKEKDLTIDKFSKIDIWLIRKYGKKLYKDFNITNDDIDIKTFINISQVFDNIYEEMNKEMPLMWFNYGFFGLPKLDKKGDEK